MFLAAPADVVIAQAVGSAVALAFNRRQPPVKLAFNIGSFALSSSIGLAVFHAVGSGPMTDPSRWLAAFLGAGIANVVGVCAVAAALTVSEGSLSVAKLRQMLGVSSVVAATNTSMALLAVIIVIADPRAAWLLVVPVATLFFGYRAFIGADSSTSRWSSCTSRPASSSARRSSTRRSSSCCTTAGRCSAPSVRRSSSSRPSHQRRTS